MSSSLRRALVMLKNARSYIDYLYIILIFIVIFSIVVWGGNVVNAPVSKAQYRQMVNLSEQAMYPHSRQLALTLLNQDRPANQFEFFRCLRLMNAEKKRIQMQPDISFTLDKQQKWFVFHQ